MKRIFYLFIAISSLLGLFLSCNPQQNQNIDSLLEANFYYDYTAYVYSYTYAEKMKLRPTDQISEPERKIGEGLSNKHGF